ncbi:hypothetical protein CYMTET_19724 [Cymbomonas tetramitiformis]|uniref:Coiled-coil domain-containing protein 12 n=1 Tax=Cymbomonas tetramitiformis TaxID=36881 RepID=A0AAE0L4P2_9CHLO|nr:hypothetical protein CYMTET_23515 [Cymbomonas tetramitiformis]KAK3271953.1 hypothetical protein CYMTET_19724 [Cymbomonas tetramitiformis]
METAAERKERLKALRQAAELSIPVEEERTLKFRNYLPKDDSLQEAKIEAAKPEEFEEPNIEPSAGLDDAIDGEEAIMSVAPKKANWDLRRDVAKKLEKLERRTQRAMVELMQEEEKRRMEAGENEEDAEMGA